MSLQNAPHNMNKNILNFKDFIFSYPTGQESNWTLSITDFSVNLEDLIVLSGDNMSGKTTLLNLLGGMLPVGTSSGHITGPLGVTLEQQALQSLSVLLSADDRMFPELSVLENIVIALPRASADQKKCIRESAEELLGRSGILGSGVFDAPLGSLSSGGRALVKLCRAYVSSCPLVIVDEISSFLDSRRSILFLDTLLAFGAAGRSVIIVSHNERDRKHLLGHHGISAYHISRNQELSVLERLEV